MEDVIKNAEEQGVAAWINLLNQVRLDNLIESLQKEKNNLSSAMRTLDNSLDTIKTDIVNNGGGRGGITGMHGFIAEVAECGFGNAEEEIYGREAFYEWIDDNGQNDLKRGAEYIQQKFVRSHGKLSLGAIKEHLDKYPNYVKEGNKYQIPKDFYEKIDRLLNMSKEEADRLPSSGDTTLKEWKMVHEFFDEGQVPFDKIEPSKLKYDEVQKDSYKNTFENEKEKIKDINKKNIDSAYDKSRPKFKEGAKAATVSALLEGVTKFYIAVRKKKKDGKTFKDFDEEDWIEILKDTGIGVLEGGVRGISLYAITNYTLTSAAVANAIVTSSFNMADQVNKFRKGEICETDLIINSEIVCLDASVSALSALIGHVVIPIPVFGAIIGNITGTLMYQIAKDNFNKNEQRIINEYMLSIEKRNLKLDNEYKVFLEKLNKSLNMFTDLLDRAFTTEITTAFLGSAEYAKRIGVPNDEILDSKIKIDKYFLL